MQQTGPLRIIHCFRSPVGGIFRHVRDLVDHQVEAGHSVGIICDSTTGGAFEDRLFEAVEPKLALGLKRLPIRRTIGLADLRAVRRTYREISELQPDVLHGHGAKGGAYARMIGSKLRVSRSRVARLYSPHGGSLHYSASSPAGRVFFAMERMLEHFTDRILFVSDYERRTYFDKVGKPRCLSALVHNGLREADFEQVDTAPDAADFLFIGMMRDIKGPDIFIRAFAAAERLVGRPLAARMVGDGDDKARYQAMIRGMGLHERIRMSDAMPAREAFRLARAVVVSSRAESMPYIVMEAVAAGKPVIASRVGGIPEILGADSIALVPPADIDSLATSMAEAIRSPESLDRAMPPRDVFRAQFSAQTMAERITALYRAAGEDSQTETSRTTASSLS